MNSIEISVHTPELIDTLKPFKRCPVCQNRLTLPFLWIVFDEFGSDDFFIHPKCLPLLIKGQYHGHN